MSRPLPPSTITPRNHDAAVLQVKSYEVAAWSPGRVGEGVPCTEIHITLNVGGIEFPLVVRLKSARAADELAGLISQYRHEVWPEDAS